MRTINVMMPKAVEQLPTGPDWTYEVKLDGYRALAIKDGRTVRLLRRTQTDLTKSFPTVAADIARLPAEQLVLDGELGRARRRWDGRPFKDCSRGIEISAKADGWRWPTTPSTCWN